MAGDLRPLFGIVEIVGEFGALVGHAVDQLGLYDPAVLDMPAQAADQFGILREAFHQDLAGAVQRRLAICHALGFVNKGICFRFRIFRRIAEQQVGQRLQSGFARNLGLGTPFFLERQVDVFQLGFGVCGLNAFCQIICELALLFDRLGDGNASVLKFAQIDEPFFEFAQLAVIEPAGGFLAVAGDEGNRRAFVQHLYRGADLTGLAADLVGDPVGDA